MRYHSLLATSALILLSQQAFAGDTPCCRGNDNPKWYAGVTTSAVFEKDVDTGITLANPGQSPFNDVSLKTGYGLGAEIGYRIYPNISVEVEGYYSDNEIDKLGNNKPQTHNNTYADARTAGAMGNLIYTYRQLDGFYPYFGAGAGVMRMIGPIKSATLGSESIYTNDLLFAYQFMAGIVYPIHNTPLEVSLGYRYRASDQGKVAFSFAPQNPLTYKFESHDIDLGVKLNF